MNENIEKLFNDLKYGDFKNLTRPSFFEEYDDAYRMKIESIAKETDKEKIMELYNTAVSLGHLSRFPEIAFAFAYNPNLPQEIVNGILYEPTVDTNHVEELFSKNKEKMSVATILKVYDIKPRTVMRELNKLRYKEAPSKEDLPLPEEVISHMALKEFGSVKPPKNSYSYYNDEADIYKYITDEKTVDAVLELVRKSTDNKEIVITELLNNHFIGEKKKDEIFDEFGCNFAFIRKPTPHIMEAIYESTVDTVFKSDMSRYSKKTPEEQRIYFDANNILGDMARYGLLTSGMQLDLMNMILERKDRSSENLTRNLISGTTDPRVLHLALQLKSTNDRDDAIKSQYLAPEDIIDVAKQSKKKIDAELKKGHRPSDKHIERLCDLCTRCTLTEDIYETMLKVKSSSLGLSLSKSKMTPNYILEECVKQVQEKDRYTTALQECYARLNIFTKNNSIPFQNFIDLTEMISMCSSSSMSLDFNYLPKRNRFERFLKESEHVGIYIEELKRLSTILTSEEAKKSVSNTLKQIEDFKTFVPKEKNPKDLSEMSLHTLKERHKRIANLTASQTHHLQKASFYIELSDRANEYCKLSAEIERREAIERSDEAR